MEYVCGFYVFVSVACGIMANEMEFFEGIRGYNRERQINLLLRITLVSNIFSVVFLYIRFHMFIQWSILKGYFTKVDTIYTSGLY